MLTKPDIKDELIISRLKDEYNLHVSTLTFLPLGADMGTAVYGDFIDDGNAYSLKLQKFVRRQMDTYGNFSHDHIKFS